LLAAVSQDGIIKGCLTTPQIHRALVAFHPSMSGTQSYRVFLSSTIKDLEEYRQIARDVARGTPFELTTSEEWEATGKNHPPLAVCLERVAKCDVLVAVVAEYYGSCPGGQKDDEQFSYTWLECQRADQEGKEILVFSVDPDYYDDWDMKKTEGGRLAVAARAGKLTPELTAEVQRNLERLKAFKQWLKEHTGIQKFFTTPEDFGQKLTNTLERWRDRQTKHKPPSEPQEQSPRELVFPETYRTWLARECGNVETSALGVKRGLSVKLNQVYVPLTTTAGQKEMPAESSGRPWKPDREKPQLLLDLLDKDSLYVAGDAGSGKSTFCKWVCWLAATGLQINHEVKSPEGYAESFPQSLRGRLPLLVRLREFWESLTPKRSRCDTMSADELEQSLAAWLDKKNPGGLHWSAHVKPHLEQGLALLLFDGVDEVPSREEDRAVGHYYPHAMLLSGLASAVQKWRQQGNRILITSRPYGLQPEEVKRLDLPEAPLTALDDPLQKLLVDRWFHILRDDPVAATATAKAMWTQVSDRSELADLRPNALLLTAMCVVFEQGHKLPEDKHLLYERIVDNVLHNRYEHDSQERRMALAHLCAIAYGMHTGKGLCEDFDQPRPELGLDEVGRLLRDFKQHSRYSEAEVKDVETTCAELLSRSGLLLERPNRRAGFFHLSFQDFLAARRLVDIDGQRLFDIFRHRCATKQWRNALGFVFSKKLHDAETQAVGLLEQLLEAMTDDDFGLAVAAAECADSIRGKGIGLRPDLAGKLRDICLAAIERESDVKDRALLGLALGKLGDPRIHSARDRAAYFTIDARPYVFGKNNEPFQIDKPLLMLKFPVTNSQFQEFIDDRGYERPDEFWSDKGRRWLAAEKVREPEYLKSSRFNAPNQPVVGVSFWEAEAFAKWAGGRLPTEHEWEAAARGPDGLVYPWGNEEDWQDGICNTWESGLGVTSAVGLFPRSRSKPFQLEDMAGNVWQWCSDVYDPSATDWTREVRVLRGGSWYTNLDSARAAIRVRFHPEVRGNDVGFRVVGC
jgi:hypothetical protein